MVCCYKISRFLFILLIPLLFNTCIKEDFDPDKLDTEIIIKPGVAAPLGYIHYELEEILKDSLHPEGMVVDNDGFIRMVYEEEIFSFQASEFLQFSDIQHSGSINNDLPVPLNLSLIQDPFIQTDTINFSLTGTEGPDYTEIDSIITDSLTIVVTLSSSYNLDGILQISSPRIIKNGAAWSATIPLSSNVQSFNLQGYTIVLSNNPPDVNLIPIIFTMTLERSQGTVPAGSPVMSYQLSVNNISYSVIYGYLGIMNITIDPQTFPVSFFNSIIDGTFHFEEPELKLYFENSFGLPIQVIMTDFYAISREGNQLAITGDSVPSPSYPRIIRYPSISEVGLTAYDSLILNPDNTNLFEALESSPGSISFGVETETNPSGNINENFITDNSQYSVKAKLILPLHGYADFMLMVDTISFNFEDFFQNPPEEIKRLAFRLNFTNGLPVNVYAQMYFTDENYAVLDSIFDSPHLVEAAADQDGDGKVDPIQNDPVEVEFIRTKIDNISTSRYILLYGNLTTTNYDMVPPENVKFYTDYFIDAYIGVTGDIELNSTGN
ncbi:MAG: hypothetical protein AMS27_04590 [Bacteroides sp. SM23_62_1]|nr:MAG: hypothetical protein AMS27_04590 [Bacteroides sp. SM23_62_1]